MSAFLVCRNCGIGIESVIDNVLAGIRYRTIGLVVTVYIFVINHTIRSLNGAAGGVAFAFDSVTSSIRNVDNIPVVACDIRTDWTAGGSDTIEKCSVVYAINPTR